jgi:hypothetical protein
MKNSGKPRWTLLGVAATLVLAAPAALAESFVLEIEALIDGRDLLILKADSLQWHHLDAAAVGRHHGANAPTIVFPYPGPSEWFPAWSQPPPSEIRWEEYSSVLGGLNPPAPTDGTPLAVQKLFGRGEVQIIQQPSLDNDYTLIVDFDDNIFAGPRYYGIVIALDSDADGVADCSDDCQGSDLADWVVIDSCETGVVNSLFATGCTISDMIGDCAEVASHHGSFVRCVSLLTRELKRDGLISGRDRRALLRCAARADLP